MKARNRRVASRPNEFSAIVVADAPNGLHASVSVTTVRPLVGALPPVPGDPSKPETESRPGPYPDTSPDPYPRPSPPVRPDVDPDPTPEPSPDPHPAPYPAPDPGPTPSPRPGTVIDVGAWPGGRTHSTN